MFQSQLTRRPSFIITVSNILDQTIEIIWLTIIIKQTLNMNVLLLQGSTLCVHNINNFLPNIYETSMQPCLHSFIFSMILFLYLFCHSRFSLDSWFMRIGWWMFFEEWGQIMSWMTCWGDYVTIVPYHCLLERLLPNSKAKFGLRASTMCLLLTSYPLLSQLLLKEESPNIPHTTDNPGKAAGAPLGRGHRQTFTMFLPKMHRQMLW